MRHGRYRRLQSLRNSELIKKLGADVHVIMTQNAINFVAPLTFETLSGNKVVTKNFDPDREWEVEHVSLAKNAISL